MSIVRIRMTGGPSPGQKRKLAAGLAGSAAETPGIPKQGATVLTEKCKWENRTTGGELHPDGFGPGHGRKQGGV